MKDHQVIRRGLKRNRGRWIAGAWYAPGGGECIGGSMQSVGASDAQIRRIRRLSRRHLGKAFEDLNDRGGERKMRIGMTRLADKLTPTSTRKGVVRQAQKDAKRSDRQAKDQTAKDARQHPCAAPASSGSGSRTGARAWLAIGAVVAVFALVNHYAALLAMIFYVVFAVVAGSGALVAGFVLYRYVGDELVEPVVDAVAWLIRTPRWGYAITWVRDGIEGRAAVRTAVTERRGEVAAVMDARSAPIAIEPVPVQRVEDWTRARAAREPEYQTVRRAV